jgi:hypothetical protein
LLFGLFGTRWLFFAVGVAALQITIVSAVAAAGFSVFV